MAWVVFAVEMVLRFFPSRLESSGCQKQFRRNYVKTGDTDGFLKAYTEVYRHYPPYVTDCVMNLLGTHDTERIMTVLGGEPAGGLPGSVLAYKRMDEEQYKHAKKLFFTAFSLLCFCPAIRKRFAAAWDLRAELMFL